LSFDKVNADEHHITEVNKFHLETAAGFSQEQAVVINNKIYALADQYSTSTNSPVLESKNLYVYDNGNWVINKLA
jgi:hypothetical protein